MTKKEVFIKTKAMVSSHFKKPSMELEYSYTDKITSVKIGVVFDKHIGIKV
ncbi:hypothetical protein GCM10007962_16540 [Yeosuana aromativorans]|uniref:Uncharacterized protein n=1 Tax=Yeosuana aromativorans TaxID=288019 RepID=A0A8J3BI22_9FLAO|nr:hypothetical protein GCM10007962_16540 [Yeosuana aromativorans]